MGRLLGTSFFSLLTIFFALTPALHSRRLEQNLPEPSSLSAISTELKYHGGPLLTEPHTINIYLIWYGTFYKKDRTPITDFFESFASVGPHDGPTVSTWWNTIRSYKDKAGKPISVHVGLAKQLGDINYSLGKNIKRDQLSDYVSKYIENKILPFDSNGVYLVLTSKDVAVERFCLGSCGFHGNTVVSSARKIVYAHVGDPSHQCPGLCSWPYALPTYGPPGPALVSPNGVGSDGLVMNIATILAGAATNPFTNGYFQGDALAPLEAVTACPGIFGAGAYPGYPGNLIVDKITNASYNAYGAGGRKFLLPAMWDPISSDCKVVA